VSNKPQHRRGFLGSALAGALAILPARALLAQPRSPDETWLRGLTGKHKQFFDVGTLQDGGPLRRVHNFLATYASAYGVAESDVNAVFGAHGSAIGFVLNDEAWSTLGLGAVYRVTDPRTKAPAVRNIFAQLDGSIAGLPVDAGIVRLQQRGVRVLACNNTLTALATRLGGTEAPKVLDQLTRAILPGVTIVPAMLIAGNRAQESGLTYAALG
jgi:intracellular sulfur oxidation DsrE/DsrF family protein